MTVIGAGVAGLTCARARRAWLPSRWSSAASAGRRRLLVVGRRHAGAVVRARDRRRARARPGARGARLVGRAASPGTVRNGSLVVAQRARRARARPLRPRTERLRVGRRAKASPRSSPTSPAASAAGCSFPTKPISIRGGRWRRWRALKDRGAGSASASRLAPRTPGRRVDCRGLAARDALPDLRGVQRRDGGVRSPRGVAAAAGADAASAHPALHRAARRRPVHGRRHHDRERRPRPGQRALGCRASERRLCAASGLRRGRDRRDWAPTCGRPFPTTCRASAGAATCCTSTACTVTASCWRRRWRAGWRRIVLEGDDVPEVNDEDLRKRRRA